LPISQTVWVLPGDINGNPVFPLPEELEQEPFLHYFSIIPPSGQKITEAEFYNAARKLLTLIAKNPDYDFVLHKQFSVLNNSAQSGIVSWYNYVFLPKIKLLSREYPQIQLPKLDELKNKEFFAYLDTRGKTHTVFFNSSDTYNAYLKSSLVVKLTDPFLAIDLNIAKEKIENGLIPFTTTGGYKGVAI